ncbi:MULTISPECIES: hypothetical protein [Amycolatopsis]|uniref:Uncharacterized protein n=1 Tax=Amycolatopsis tucumanensis TaxID=401106 RepID=A0ABP7HZK1_9PSEU|nr:hypothetical protein [Amycolatopsis tucumanensis]MCF6421916.1 hypothetical protein [Amycolatopsis tucumanensis]
MVILLILLGILLCGVVAGLVMRPRARAAQDAFADGVQALAARTGWRPGHAPLPPLQSTFVTIDDVLGSSNHLPAEVAQRITTQTVFFTTEHIAAVFPGELTQQDLTTATADLLADLSGARR